MIFVMVKEFREMQSQLAMELEHYETPRFKALDERISRLFDAIYRYTPENAVEAHTVMDFLLDLIETNDVGDNGRLIERVRALADSCVCHQPPPLEITAGAGI